MSETEQKNAAFRIDTDNGQSVASFSGDWLMAGHPPAFDANGIKTACAGTSSIHVETAQLGRWDSGLLVFLVQLIELAKKEHWTINLDALDEGITRLLNLATTVPERQGARREEDKISWVTRLGETTIRGFSGVYDTLTFIGETIEAFGALIRGKARFRRSDLLVIIQECGTEALPIVTLISVLVGMILAFLGSVQLKMFGAQIFVADLVGVGMMREMGALMTGIIMAGRTGAAFAAQLGTMQVNEEIDALKTMGFSPMEFLVLPRMIALILMMPLLCIYANLLGIAGGAIVGIGMLDLSLTQYFTQTAKAISMNAFASGLIKSSVFGVLVAIAGCMNGIRSGRSASAVGDATTRAVVSGIVYIVVWDSLLSIIFTITGF